MKMRPVKFGVAFDGSVQGQKALERCLLVAKSDDEIQLIHAIDPPRTDPPFGLLLEEAEKVVAERKQQALEMLEPIVSDLKKRGINYKIHIQSGDPRTFIEFVVEEEHLDFMFLGSRGLSALKGFLVGSTSQYCVNNCKCAVVVVK